MNIERLFALGVKEEVVSAVLGEQQRWCLQVNEVVEEKRKTQGSLLRADYAAVCHFTTFIPRVTIL